MTKTESERIHTKRRALERFGITLTTLDIKRIVKNIQDSKYEFLCRDSHRVSKWKVDLNGQTVCAVYDRDRKNLITVMPMSYVIMDQMQEVEREVKKLIGNNFSEQSLLRAVDRASEDLEKVHKWLMSL